MKVTHNIEKSGLDRTKKIYTCSNCDKLFNWNNESSWYGSDKEFEETPDRIKYYCSNKCSNTQSNEKH